jgi:hypothetical protein
MEEMIEHYLLGLLSEAETKAFENRIATDENLAREVAVQRDIMQAAKLQGLKADINNAYRNVRMGKMLKTAFISVVVAAVLGLGIYYLAKILTPKIDATEIGASLPTSVFNIDNTRDTVIETQNGIIFHIPANAFGDVNTYDLEIKVALDALDIMEAELSTMSDSNLLATAGMFKITATKDGVELQLADGKKITAQVPTDEVDPDIMLFDGVEDSTGNVNWVNPKKIKNYLITRSFDDLDFYPRGYLAKVAELGYDASDKQFTDSLYWSFDCRIQESFEVPEEISLVKKTNFSSHSSRYRSDGWQPKTGFIKSDLTKEKNTERIRSNLSKKSNFWLPRLIKFQNQYGPANLCYGNEWMQVANGDYWGSELDIILYTENQAEMWRISEFSGDTVRTQNEIVTNTVVKDGSTKQICPASIQALQTKRFTKTYIATKEFEQRLQHLFEICDETSLNVYIANLDKDISYSDSIVASRISGAKKAIFERFAAQKLGNTEKANPAFAKLGAYHKKKKDAYDKAARKARKKVLDKYAKEDATKQNRDLKKSTDESQDRANVFEKELKTNLIEAYRQAGISYPSPLAPKAMYTVPITTTGWKNLDQYVTASTISRTSLKTTYNNKDISIEYHKLKVQVENEASYDFVNVYLIPNKLPSYQKMNKKDAVYSETLNELFDYELVCLAKKGSEYFVYTDLLQKKNDTKSVTLRSINKKELKTLLKSMNKRTANRNVADDLEYEEQNFLYNQNLKKRKKDEAFRQEIEGVIWPCGDVEVIGPEPATSVDGLLPEHSKIITPTFKQNMASDSSIAFTNGASSLRKRVSKDAAVKAKPTTFPTQTHLFTHLQTEYPSFYNQLQEDFDLTDSTFHASFQVNYCNFKKTPILNASDATKTKKYELPLRRNFGKELEIREIFQASAKDKNPCLECGDVSMLD